MVGHDTHARELEDELSLEGDQYVTFDLADEAYGVDILKVQEIIGYRGFTALPNVPDWIKGVLNLRGAVVPVVDLRAKFRMPPTEYGKFTVVMIVVVQGRTMGMVVDAVSDVVAFPPSDIQPRPAFSSRIRHEFIKGMGRRGDHFVILLDIERMLSLEELDLVDETAAV